MDHAPIVWSDALLVGEPGIDGQHRRLIELFARIPEQAAAADASLLPEALAYAAHHFAQEEAYMARVGYPGLASHRVEHKVLTRTLLAYKRDYDDGRTDLYNLKHLLFRWVRDHIMEVDQRVGHYLKTQRLGGGA